MPSTTSHIENSTQENTNPPFLWGDVTRRPKHKATGENQSLMVILAEIFTGRASQQFSSVLWPDLHDELTLNRLIGDIWRERRAVRSEENTRAGYGLLPTELPIPAEARQVSYPTSRSLAIFALKNHLHSSETLLESGVAIQ